MTKTVLDVGNCPPDHAAIQSMLQSHFDVLVLQAHGPGDTLQILESRAIDLVLINRKLDQDYSDGIEVLKQIKADPRFAEIAVMLVTNYEDAQQAAIDLGANRGFGKLALSTPETQAALSSVLESTAEKQSAEVH